MMTEEDQELCLEMLIKLDGSRESVTAASKWCRANAANHEEIVRMWFFAIAKARSQARRLDLFHLASDILFTAEPTSVQYYSSFLPQLFKAVPFVRGEEVRIPMKKLFTLWREKNVYNKIVMDRLDRSLRNRNRVVDMAIFKYDRELMFKNLKRVEDLKPACDYLSHGVELAPSYDNSQMLLGTIKDRKACQSLLAAVDSHKSKVTSLVSYMEEMVHLLKMASVTTDLAINREQNGVEETKMRILAYGRFGEKLRSVLSGLEDKWGLSKIDYEKPFTPASPEPERESLYSRRSGTVGVAGDPRMANTIPLATSTATIPTAPITDSVIPLSPVWSGAVPFPKETTSDIFHRRDKTGSATPRRDEVPFLSPRPPLPKSDFPFASPRSVSSRDDFPFASPRSASSRDDFPFANPQPPLPRDDVPFSSRPTVTPTRKSTWYQPSPVRSKTLGDEAWESPRLPKTRDDPWDTPRPQRPRDEPWDTPRPTANRDEPWDTPRPHLSDPWDARPRNSLSLNPTLEVSSSPSYSGSSTWGSKKRPPVYMPCYTGFHLEDSRRPPVQRTSVKPESLGSNSLFPHPPTRPKAPLLPTPKIASLMSVQAITPFSKKLKE